MWIAKYSTTENHALIELPTFPEKQFTLTAAIPREQNHPHYNSDCYIYKQPGTAFCSLMNQLFFKKSIKKPCQTKADKEYF